MTTRLLRGCWYWTKLSVFGTVKIAGGLLLGGTVAAACALASFGLGYLIFVRLLHFVP